MDEYWIASAVERVGRSSTMSRVEADIVIRDMLKIGATLEKAEHMALAFAHVRECAGPPAVAWADLLEMIKLRKAAGI